MSVMPALRRVHDDYCTLVASFLELRGFRLGIRLWCPARNPVIALRKGADSAQRGGVATGTDIEFVAEAGAEVVVGEGIVDETVVGEGSVGLSA